jgi:ribose-phosphate pyrophosphokinase
MISVNKQQLALTSFPDGTLSFKYSPKNQKANFLIDWAYDNEQECMALWYLVNHIREHEPLAKIVLDMPYLPNARMDRVKGADDVFTLKWFAKLINGMGFENVYIRDPHSAVGSALINRVICYGVDDMVFDVRTHIKRTGVNLVYCYPDIGAAKKYTEQIENEHVFGIKRRDWKTGEIKEYKLSYTEPVKDSDVLIIDDICSRGGTFLLAAQALKAAGALNIYLFITHCENTILDGDIPDSDLISGVFTSPSIFRGSHTKVNVLDFPKQNRKG